MQCFPPKTARAGRPEPFWQRYLFAIAVSVSAWVGHIYLSYGLSTPLTPFLLGFAAVIASAGLAGCGPGIVSTIIVMGWCIGLLHLEHRLSPAEQAVRAAIFLSEGLLLSAGSSRMRRALHDATRSEDWHRKLVDTTSEGIWIVDEGGIIAYANPRIVEIAGVPAHELTGRPMEDFFFPEDCSMEAMRFRNRHAGMREQFDRRLRRSDGSEAWVLCCSNAFVDAQSGVLGVLSMMTDITERKRAEQALRRSEERFRGLFENVLEGVYQSTPEGRILAANPMLLRMLGLSSEAELNEVNIARDLYVDRGVRNRLLEKLERDGSFQNVEYELRRADDEIITVHENARVVRDEEGRILYYEGTLTDITERAAGELQSRQARKAESLGLLAGGIANDFSNVLTILSGYANLVLDELPPSHPARANAERLVMAAESAAGLTRQLLSFDHGEGERAEVTDLNGIVRDSEEAIRTFLKEQHSGADADVILSLDSRPLPVRADSGHLRQVLMSLIATVRDSARGGDAVRLATGASRRSHRPSQEDTGDLPGAYAVITVESSEALLPGGEQRAAEPADGLGVSATQAILSQYGGTLSMERSATGTACFAVYLPLVEEIGPGGSNGLFEAPRHPQAENDNSRQWEN